MKTKIIFLFFFALLFQADTVEAQKIKPAPKAKILSAREIAEKILPSVVLITTQDENGNPISQGSGFVYKPGLVVTNLHVFERATNAIVKNVKTVEISKAVEVVGMNARQDLCVIRIDKTAFPVIQIGDAHQVRTGDEIYVASNPKGLVGSFSKGIVSSVREKERTEKSSNGALDAFINDALDTTDRTLFQIDAAISSGSSGGVVVNTKGEAIGIVKSSLVSGQNLNFAIPVEQLGNLRLNFKHPIQLAGACAYRDRDKEKLRGLVKTVTEKERYRKVENGRLIESEPLATSIRVFDVDGNEIQYTVFQSGANFGKLAWKFTFSYDENRLKTTLVEEYLSGRKPEVLFSKEDAIYNKLLSRRFSGSIGSLGKDTGMQVFDSNGNMVIWYIEDIKQTFEYENDGRVREKTQWRNGKIQRRTRYRYKDDHMGNWIEKYELTNFPNNPNQFRPDEWIEGDTEYREITYYE